ncbi:hypothetical protein SO802_025026 [Lithocarpus litseifolius]|uniref:GH18 domain-containing protein n=1 Tax=Lithocarpus litseifolius TaxID=425828 RepID=A0AAW2BXC4_9ROSI
MVGNRKTRAIFVNLSIKVARKFRFNGLDLDWEFPANKVDRSNFALLFTEWQKTIMNEAKSSGKPRLLLTFVMEVQNSEHGHIIEVCGDVQAAATSFTGSKICGEAPCGFSDAKASSKDAKEQSASMRKLLIAVVLCIIFMSVEVVGGIKANSLAILTDAAHLLSNVAAFAIALFSLWASGWEAGNTTSVIRFLQN